jgi:hypothetical protein
MTTTFYFLSLMACRPADAGLHERTYQLVGKSLAHLMRRYPATVLFNAAAHWSGKSRD